MKRFKSKYDSVMPKDILELRDKAEKQYRIYEDIKREYRDMYLAWRGEVRRVEKKTK